MVNVCHLEDYNCELHASVACFTTYLETAFCIRRMVDFSAVGRNLFGAVMVSLIITEFSAASLLVSSS